MGLSMGLVVDPAVGGGLMGVDVGIQESRKILAG